MKSLKRALCVCLTLAMLLSMLPLSVYAATDMKLTADAVSAKMTVGSQIKVDVTMSDNPGLTGGQVDVKFEREKLKLVGIENKLQTITENYNGEESFPVTSGEYTLAWDNPTRKDNFTGTGVIATLVFEVLDTATVGDSAVQLSTPDFYNADGDEVSTVCENGKIALWAELSGFVGFNLEKPRKGGKPQTIVNNTSVTGTVYYTGTVAWAPDHTTFAPGTAYTANVTLTPSAGYKFVPSGANATKISYPDGAVSNLTVAADGSTLTFTVLFAATASADPLTGTVTIDGATDGKAKFGDTLTATPNLNYGNETLGTLDYRWMRDDKGIANATHNNTYTTVEADIGHKISVEVWNSNNTGSVTSDPVTIGKALNGTNPDDPSVGFDGLGQTSITVTYDHEGDYEFACVEWTDGYQEGDISNAVWQDSKTFTGLKPNTPYYIYVRVKATATHEASTAAYTTANTARYEVANDADLKAKLDASVSALNREYNYGWDYPIEVVDQRLPAGWSYSYSTDGRNFSTSKPATIRDVSSSGKYYVKFEHHDYKAYIAEFDVTIRPKDITPKDGVNIVKANYTEPTYTGSALTLSDLVLYWRNAVQDVTLNVGTDVAIAYSNNVNRPYGTITVTAVEGGNYTGSCNVSFTINPKPVTVTITVSDKDYDGTTDATVASATVNAKAMASDEVTVDTGKLDAKFADKDAGEDKAVHITNVMLTGADARNYSVDATYDTSATIRAKDLTGTNTTKSTSLLMKSSGAFADPVIDGVNNEKLTSENGTFTYSYTTIDGTQLTDAEAISSALRALNTVKDYSVSYTFTPNAGSNYTGTVTGTLTVSVKDIEFFKPNGDPIHPAETLLTVTNGIYNAGKADAYVSFPAGITAKVDGTTISGKFYVTVDGLADGAKVPAGTQKFRLHFDSNDGTYNGVEVCAMRSATIYPASIEIDGSKIKVADRAYDGTTTVSASQVDLSGLKMHIKDGEKTSAIANGEDITLSYTATYDEANAGDRLVEFSNLTLTGADKDNYSLLNSYSFNVDAKITKKTVSIPATNNGIVVAPREYDGTNKGTQDQVNLTGAILTGVLESEKANVALAQDPFSIIYSSKTAGSAIATLGNLVLTGTAAKNYELKDDAIPVQTSITQRTIAISSIDVADKIYDGGTDAQITNITYGNIVSGDQVYARILASFADANAGGNKTVTFNVDGLAGEDAGNYERPSTLPAATATIHRAQLVGTPTFGKVTKAGTKLSEVDYDLSGIKGVNGEAVLVSFGWDDLTPADTTVEANKAYGWKVTTTNPNYEDLTGSTVLYPVSTSYSDQVKKQSEEFEAKKRGELPEDELDFRDVYEDDYFFDAVQWAAENGITGGVGNGRFGPSLDCSRGQTMTFLWRASGEPEPDPISTDLTDVAADSYYYEAVLWAMQEGVTTGAGAGRFAPDATVTRGQFVTFLYRLAGASSDGVHPFADVPAGSYYEKAIAWAFAEGITRGTSGTTFSPDAPCTRAQIITFLYRYFNR